MRVLLLFLMSICIWGCSSLASLTSYTVNNSELETVLSKQLLKLNDNTRVLGVPVEIALNDLAVDIGPDNRNVIRLTVDADAIAGMLGFTYPAKVTLSLEGAPSYNASEKAIYVQSLTLLDSSIETGGFSGNLAPVSDDVMALVNSYLKTNPVYTLDTSQPGVAWLATIPLNMSVEAGKIRFAPATN
ncbi:DUF1439 domain-containing protein [Alteromonas sp. 14N.309.X.WAT.G.H12]|uniref:DUF1439 domain-containing protein n=1 Tax=Alteromonas sp. 14N.309.X.WAT.G.H12 TaxID=3120824 RepID=UPI002FD704FB